jgi:hypothetical protein
MTIGVLQVRTKGNFAALSQSRAGHGLRAAAGTLTSKP